MFPFKYIGVICAALIVGYIVGVRDRGGKSVTSVDVSDNQTSEIEKSTTTTETTERPDGSRTIKTVTDTTKKTDKKEKKEAQVPVKERLRQFRTTVAVRPEWDNNNKTIKGHPVFGVSKRIWDSPAWADAIVDVDRKEVSIGISLEW